MNKKINSFKSRLITFVLMPTLLVSIVITSFLLIACGGDDVLDVPTVITGKETSFNIDLKTTKTHRITISDYIDSKNIEDIKYKAEKSNDYVNIPSTISGSSFTVTLVSVGQSEVTLSAMINDVVKASVKFTFTIVDTSPKEFSVSGIADGTGYTMTGNASAMEGSAYIFSVTIDDLYVVSSGVTAKYKVGNAAEKNLTGVKNTGIAKETYDFTVPAGEVTGNITISAVSGITLNSADSTSVTGIADGKDYTMIGSSAAFVNKNYIFTVIAPTYYTAAVAKYKVGTGTEKTLTGVKSEVSSLDNSYEFIIPQSEIDKNAALAITKIELTLGIANFADSFYKIDSWGALSATGTPDGADYAVPPTIEVDESIKFQDTFIIAQSQAGNAAIAPSADQYYQMSFNVKTAGDFEFAFFATGNLRINSTKNAFNWSTDNYVKLYSSNGVVGISSAQASGAIGIVPAGIYTQGNWNRIDLCYYRVGEGGESKVTIKLFINGELVELEEATNNDGDKMTSTTSEIKDGNLYCNQFATPNYGNRTGVHAGADAVYVKKVA